MKKLLLVTFCIFYCAFLFAQAKDSIALIPQPVSLIKKTGQFVLPERVIIITDNNEAIKKSADRLAAVITTATGYHATVQTTGNVANSIRLVLTKNKLTPTEG